jgi:hypothetical protein
MSKANFHYAQQSLQNDLVAVEPFDVSVLLSLVKVVPK